MAQLILNVTLNSTEADGNVSNWWWSLGSAPGTAIDDDPPPRMQTNDTISIVVTDQGNAPSLAGLIIVSPKIENPIKARHGKASPFQQQGPNNTTTTLCYQSLPATAANGGVYTFTPPTGVLLVKGAWELTVVITRSDTATQFELDPEFDVGT
jgi:hypothetical protein